MTKSKWRSFGPPRWSVESPGQDPEGLGGWTKSEMELDLTSVQDRHKQRQGISETRASKK